MSISKIQRVPLREVWPSEPQHFTVWLEDNIDALSDALDITLTVAEREAAAGDFSVDLVAEDEAGRVVIIENQLTPSDHTHLGQVLTYLTSLGSEVAIWIVGKARPEHTKAVSWLNESSSASFYLVQVEAIRIGESDPAALFTLITGPSVEARAAGATKKELAERHVIRKRFWSQLLDYARDKSRLHANISPGTSDWVGASAGISGFAYNYVMLKHDARIELYIDRGDGEANAAVFEQLHAGKDEIEATFGGPLVWQRLEGKRACRVRFEIPGVGWRDEEEWPQAIQRMVDAMVRFDRALSGPVRALRLP